MSWTPARQVAYVYRDEERCREKGVARAYYVVFGYLALKAYQA